MDLQNDPIAVTRITDGCRVSLLGPIHTNVAWLESAFARIIAAKPKIVELDLGKMSFTSSLGVGMLVSFRNAVAGYGGDLKTVAITEPVLKIIKFSFLNGLLKVGPETVIVKS